MRMVPLVITLSIMLSLSPTRRIDAQLATPGPSGVVMGHLHLTTADMEASRRFWTALGGSAVQNGQLQLLQFPMTFVMLRQGAPKGGSEGSTVDRVTFKAKAMTASMERWKADGIQVVSGGIVAGPDGLTINLFEDAAIPPAIQFAAIGFRAVSPAETRDWYVKTFGAAAGTGQSAGPSGAKSPIDIATLPGVTLEFRKADTAPAGTRGRALDHIGFEVKGLEEFCKKLESAGLKFDRPFTRLPNSTVAIAFLTDPWGTYIELTENLAPAR